MEGALEFLLQGFSWFAYYTDVTLQQEFPSPKFRQPLDLQCNVVYKIPCADCCWSYVGETGRCFKTRRKEHQRNLKNYTRGSNIATMLGKTIIQLILMALP